MEEKNVLESVGPIVATEEPGDAALAAWADFDRRIRDIEAVVQELRSMKAQGEPSFAGRKTVPVHQASILAKSTQEQVEGTPVDDALRSLSVEQRIAVKSGLLRAGLLR